MSFDAILDAIAAAGELQLAQLQQQTAARVQRLMAEAEVEAAGRRQKARQAALEPVAGERARRLHQARLEALHEVAAAREELVNLTLAETRSRLMALRDEPIYARVLRGLIGGAIEALGEQELHHHAAGAGRVARLQVDARDEALARAILSDLDIDLAVEPSLDCWGGVSLGSSDGRITVTNTLESRLARALAYLRPALAAFYQASVSAPPDEATA